MKATLRDVANAAGVSVMSACAVLTGGGQNVKVSAERAKLIREKALELAYEPNLMGRGLRTRKTEAIGVVFQNLTSFGADSYYYQQLMDGIMSALFPRGYTLSLCPMLVQSEGSVRISNGRFDGILWCAPDLIETSIDAVKGLRMPLVMVHAPPEVAMGIPTFTIDNKSAMERVVQHLVEVGHQKIAFVVKPHVARTVEGKERAESFVNAAERLGVKADVLHWEFEAEDLAKYVSDDAPHTALAAYNDIQAAALLTRAKELGIRVPEDLSIIGFDSSSFCERTQPRLTSVHQPIERIAHEATLRLLQLINAEPQQETETPPNSTLYDCRLDVRESTAAPNPHRRGNESCNEFSI